MAFKDPPDNWRERDVESPDIGAEEKETTLAFPNKEDTGILYSDVPTIIKWVQSVEESNVLGVTLSDSGSIVGVKARIPKGIVKLQGSARKSNAHSQMVTYGPKR